eukprot:CAMPEP_0172931794 /NCGR_PEP_ID=MMETSP1075-20121228/219675_1 /TAXON_ID=2916 /ORGANISM="Ceratium fusus, Strain PA161109" /LENGTH=296 /DNA_ID=CAMNT_0013793117 /DNA_START=246 /DNA_END=1136 /DNA_ORIENTATION=+
MDSSKSLQNSSSVPSACSTEGELAAAKGPTEAADMSASSGGMAMVQAEKLDALCVLHWQAQKLWIRCVTHWQTCGCQACFRALAEDAPGLETGRQETKALSHSALEAVPHATLLLLLQGVNISARKACASSMCDEPEGVGSRLPWSPGNQGIVPFSAGSRASCTLLLLLQGVNISARKACASSMCDEPEGVGSRLPALQLTPRISVSAASAASEARRKSRVRGKLPVDFGRWRLPLLPLLPLADAGDRTGSTGSLNGGLKRDREESLRAVGGGKSLGDGGLVPSTGICSEAKCRKP